MAFLAPLSNVARSEGDPKIMQTALYFDTVQSGHGKPQRYPGIVGDGHAQHLEMRMGRRSNAPATHSRAPRAGLEPATIRLTAAPAPLAPHDSIQMNAKRRETRRREPYAVRRPSYPSWNEHSDQIRTGTVSSQASKMVSATERWLTVTGLVSRTFPRVGPVVRPSHPCPQEITILRTITEATGPFVRRVLRCAIAATRCPLPSVRTEG